MTSGATAQYATGDGAATDCNEVQRLDERQVRAVDLLAGGMALGEVAAELRIDRTTLYRWRREASFVAELNKRRAELWQVSTDRFRALLPRALDTLGQAIDEGDWRAAATVLRLAGVGELDLRSIGWTDPREIEEAEAAEAARRRSEREEDEVREAERRHHLELRRMFAT